MVRSVLCQDGMVFSGNLRPADVLMDMTGSDHLPIQTVISFGHHNDSVPSFLFKMNVSHLESLDFKA
jgi:hypothetical protein